MLIHYIGVSVSDLLHFAQCKKFDHILEVICSKLMFFPLLSKCITKQVTYLIITIIEVIEDLILLLVVSAVSHLQCLIFLCILSFVKKLSFVEQAMDNFSHLLPGKIYVSDKCARTSEIWSA